MTADEIRMRTVVAGDPVSDYFGFPETQRQIIEAEREEQARAGSNDTTPPITARVMSSVMFIEPILPSPNGAKPEATV